MNSMRFLFMPVAASLLISFCTNLYAQEPVFNRAPLVATQYAELPLGAVRAEGWLLDQLERQRDGLTGHLDSLYAPIVGDNNAWLGGDGDTWERGPYWIDGLLPLAYILDDKALIDKALKWVNAMLSSAREDGYFGNATDHPYIEGFQRGKSHDWWPKMVALKILQQYYMATGDTRALDTMAGYFRYQAAHLDAEPLNHWSKWGMWRGGDNLDMILWLYSLNGDSSLLDLARKVHAQTYDWTGVFLRGDVFRTQNSVHCVNLGQGFKEPVVWWQLSQDPDALKAPEKALEAIRTTIGLPTGLWAGDELIHFGEPARGSEFCTAAEMMYSLEEMLRITGNPRWADHLERVAFNALPTQATDAYDARQYFQQTNQIACTREPRSFVTEHYGTDNVFGLLNGYPCCTCNMHQAWPKFTRNLWMATRDGGLAALYYAPCRVETTLEGHRIVLREETSYPFSGDIRFTVDFPDVKLLKGRKAAKMPAVSFPIYVRIPDWCREAKIMVNDEESVAYGPGETVCLQRAWRKGDVVEVHLPMEVTTGEWYDRATVVERGPLVYALKMEEHWTRKPFLGADRAKYGEGYYEVTSDSPWNYGLSRKLLKENPFLVETRPVDGYPWNVENAPVTIRTKAVILPYWKRVGGSVGPVPYFTENGDDTAGTAVIELIPYGCTTLRIAEFPTRR
jgi:hypothetical protein